MDDLQQRYQELQTLEKHMERLNEQLRSLEEKNAEIQTAKEAIEDIAKTETGKQILVPVSNGIFAKATLTNNTELLVNVGADTIVAKSTDDAKALLEKQENELESYKKSILEQMTSIDQHAYQIEAEIKKRSR